MKLTIFCPEDHLMLDAERCPVCGWQKPSLVSTGEFLWEPLDLEAGFGGPGRSVFAHPALLPELIAIPLNTGQFVGIDLESGRQRWHTVLDKGLVCNHLVADQNRILASVSDNRSLEQAGSGQLMSVNPVNGEIKALWSASGYQLSAPNISESLIFVRTPGDGLVALTRSDTPQVAWKVPLNAWWPHKPFLASDMVLVPDGEPVKGSGFLYAFELKTGKKIWQISTQGLISHEAVHCQNVLIIRDGRDHLRAIDLDAKGKTLWEQSYDHLYASTCSGKGKLFLVSRGEAAREQEGHYILHAVEIQNGELIWQVPLPAKARPRSGPLLSDHILILFCDDGQFLAYDPENGNLHWQKMLSHDEDPPRTTLVSQHGVLFAGTAFGKLFAIQIAKIPETKASPEDYIERDDIESAAAALALNGDYENSAYFYQKELKQPRRAAIILDKGGMHQKAGELALSENMLRLAREQFKKATLPLREAEVLALMGNSLEAASLYKANQAYREAGEQYEKAGDLRSALDCYDQIGDEQQIQRLRPYVPISLDDISRLEEVGKLKEAGEAALEVGAWRKAVSLFNQAKEYDLEYQALIRLTENEDQDWAWERIAEMARERGEFVQQARALLELEEFLSAAEAYQYAAKQAEQRSPDEESKIGDFYNEARKLFQVHGADQEYEFCLQKVIHYHRLPHILIQGTTENVFQEGAWNKLLLEYANIGRGGAYYVTFHTDTTRFDIEQEIEPQPLAPNNVRKIEIYIRPKEGEFGEGTPLKLTWEWMDRKKNSYRETIVRSVHVKAHYESDSSGKPLEIHYHDQVFQSEGGKIEVMGGVSGDVISGGHKGDSMSIERPGKTDIAMKQKVKPKRKQFCPICSLPLNDGEDFCRACGWKDKAEE